MVAPRMLDASLERQAAVLAHELGHAALLHLGFSQHSEHNADEMAKALFGHKIKYDKALVQSWSERACYDRRPDFLPK